MLNLAAYQEFFVCERNQMCHTCGEGCENTLWVGCEEKDWSFWRHARCIEKCPEKSDVLLSPTFNT